MPLPPEADPEKLTVSGAGPEVGEADPVAASGPGVWVGMGVGVCVG